MSVVLFGNCCKVLVCIITNNVNGLMGCLIFASSRHAYREKLQKPKKLNKSKRQHKTNSQKKKGLFSC